MPEVWSAKVEYFVHLFTMYGVFWFYLLVFTSAVFENFFPPYPGDTVTFVGGYLAGMGVLSFPLVFILASSGALTGAVVLYLFGKNKGRRLFLENRGRFFNKGRLEKIENWFQRYGEKVILISRFLTGIRSGVALTAGIGNINWKKMITYSLISIFLWNGLILYLAYTVQDNWRKIYDFFHLYNRVILILGVMILLLWLASLLRKKMKAN
jgi:membrane protein DedA with SNARE-associated domain